MARKRFTRSLRFVLTASYAVFFTLLISTVGLIFRENLKSSLDQQLRERLDQEWAAVKGYLRIEKGRPIWYADMQDDDEAAIVGRLKSVYLLTDANGNEKQSSTIYRSLGIDPPGDIRKTLRSQHIVWNEKHDPKGVPYLIRAGAIYDEQHSEMYYLAIGRSLADSRGILQSFTWVMLGVMSLMVVGGCLLGWIYAGRALTPVLHVAQAAQRISSSNLSLRIPTRQAGDELDFLIETFNQMIERLENSFRQVRQFSTDVSHELRTPITVIRGQLEVALFTAQNTDQYREAILESMHEIERLSQIVRALLLLAQAETGQVVLQKIPIDLCAVVRDMVDEFQIPAEEARVHLVAGEMPPECTGDLDRVQIERMISNLLSNALKFTPPGGQVTVSIIGRQNEVELHIADTGLGISPEHLPHIFDRFYRITGNDSSSPSPEKGLGLGLSFVSWIVKAHNGAVDVKSTPGQGTEFIITLPAVRVASAIPVNNS